MTTKQLQALARAHGTPVVVIDHDIIRRNYAAFRKHLPKVQAYYAVKANPEPAIVRTLYKAGASFDVASLPEFMLVYENIKHLPPKEQQDFIWDKIIYANPTKPKETLQALDQYKPLVTYDNLDRAEEDPAIRAARRRGAAPARAQHRLDGRAVLQVRLRPRRGGGPDRWPPSSWAWSSRA